jgi:para-nitrobenzyl esterase
MTTPAQDALFPCIDTTTGRLRGLANSGVRIFRGIPYGQDTGGANRFQPPRAKAPWPGTRDCFASGPVAPQLPSPLTNLYAQLIHFEMTVSDGGMSEDCLTLNVWAPEGEADAARPVVVVIHGGGYALGSGNSPMYDGAQLALEQQVVVVSINHRLGCFGAFGAGALGDDPRFARAGHVGLLDITLALTWLRDNAAAFGGDPARVTLIGQSGGGWKVGAMLALPAARGLFHRAVIQSGSWVHFGTPEQGTALSAALMAELGLQPGDADGLCALDFTAILAAQARVGALFFMPFLGEGLPWHPLSAEAMALNADVPLIIATTLDDAGLFFDHFDLDEAGLAALLAQRYGEAGAPILAAYRAAQPAKPPYLLHAQMVTDAGFRRFALMQAAAKVAAGGAPVWMYRWDWPSPAWDGRFGATHAMDVSASLAHPRDSLLGGGARTGARLARALSSALGAFAATGDPATPQWPDWQPWTPEQRACLLLGEEDRLAADPDRHLRGLWEAMPLPASVLG